MDRTWEGRMMKTIFVLLVFSGVTMGHGVAVTTHTFQTAQACHAAADWYNAVDYWMAGA